MKKVLIENLWLMAIGWCLYLNDHILASAAIMCFAALYGLYVIGEVDVLRCAVTFIGIYILTLCLYLAGNIPYFFPSLHTFGAMIAFDAAILQELMYKIRRKEILTILSFMLMAYLLITLLVIFVDESDYALFGKSSLFLMNAFIFLPFLMPSVLVYVHRTEQAIARKQQKATGKIADI